MAGWITISLLILVGLITLNGVNARLDGAPTEACATMMPQHGDNNEPSSLPPPFTISVNKQEFVVDDPVRGQCSFSAL